MLAKNIIEILNLPEWYVDENNATTMINFWPIISEFAKIFHPNDICEIGSERGLTSQRLAELLPDADIHVVDPFIAADVKAMKNTRAYEETSEKFLKRKLPINFYLIDGDHNYETVSMEIALASENAAQGPFCAMFHDIGWPFARRDGYYNPKLVKTPHPHQFDSYLSLEDDLLRYGRHGFETQKVFALANNSGGEHNGVLTAIEDFIETKNQDWRLLKVPMFFGLGLVWDETHMSQDSINRIRELEKTVEFMRPMMAAAEANRLRLIQSLAIAEIRHAEAEASLNHLRRIPLPFPRKWMKRALQLIQR